MKKTFFYPFLLFVGLAFVCQAQEINPIAFDLSSPIDVHLDVDGNSWVTTSGTGADDGQVVRINTDFTIDTIITGLPSYFNFLSNELQGALSAQLHPDGRIMLMQGGGIAPESSSVIEFHLDDYLQKGAALELSEYRSIAKVGAWALDQGYAESNPYSMVFDADGNYIIADAAANAVFKYDVSTASFSVVADLPSTPNPLPFGPPFIEPVPTKILAHPEEGWLVSTLTGFPFVDGEAKVYHIQENGSMEIYQDGLTLITDMEFDPFDGQLLVHQFGKFGQVDTTMSFLFGSAQTIKVDDQGNLDTLLSDFGPGAGMAIADDGSIYLTHLFLGQLLKAESVLSSAHQRPTSTQEIRLFPNPTTGYCSARLAFEQSTNVHYRLLTLTGEVIRFRDLGWFPAGEQTLELDLSTDLLVNGQYILEVRTNEQLFIGRIVLNK